MNYDTVDTLVATNGARTNSVRVSATTGADNRNALLYTSRSFRVTLFEPDSTTASQFNELIASMYGDREMLESLDQFTNRYCA